MTPCCSRAVRRCGLPGCGFNLSHGLGAIVFGVAVLADWAQSRASFEAQASVFLPLAVLVSATYLVLGLRYWFRTPIMGISLASICFVRVLAATGRQRRGCM